MNECVVCDCVTDGLKLKEMVKMVMWKEIEGEWGAHLVCRVCEIMSLAFCFNMSWLGYHAMSCLLSIWTRQPKRKNESEGSSCIIN